MPTTIDSGTETQQDIPGGLARFTVEQYHRMIASGAIAEDDRIELLDGLLVRKVTKNPLHSIVTRSLDKRIVKKLPRGWHVRNQEPITLDGSEQNLT